MDQLTPQKRSWNMSKIRSKNTKPEIFVRSLLHRRGYRFRLHRKNLPGKPDIILPKYKAVIFVHGCFWHRHDGCKYTYNPKTRMEFWKNKFAENVQRDKLVQKKLIEEGWNVLIIWECELENLQMLEAKLEDFFITIDKG
ncbi:MAG: very short patch repair endonuclease [Synergistaceae bacterium]|nr:very short patch repair endonuclease [Synergistaceae bacterium]